MYLLEITVDLSSANPLAHSDEAPSPSAPAQRYLRLIHLLIPSFIPSFQLTPGLRPASPPLLWERLTPKEIAQLLPPAGALKRSL